MAKSQAKEAKQERDEILEHEAEENPVENKDRETGEQKQQNTTSLREAMDINPVSRLSDARKKSMRLYKNFAENADNSAHDHPWRFIGTAGLIGLVFGMLLGRRI